MKTFWYVITALLVLSMPVFLFWPGEGGRADAMHFLTAVIAMVALVTFGVARDAR